MDLCRLLAGIALISIATLLPFEVVMATDLDQRSRTPWNRQDKYMYLVEETAPMPLQNDC